MAGFEPSPRGRFSDVPRGPPLLQFVERTQVDGGALAAGGDEDASATLARLAATGVTDELARIGASLAGARRVTANAVFAVYVAWEKADPGRAVIMGDDRLALATVYDGAVVDEALLRAVYERLVA